MLFVRFVGKFVWYSLGLVLYGLWIINMFYWLGLLGAIAAFILVPGAIAFPLIYWLVEGSLPWGYVLIWVGSMIGVTLSYLAREDRGEGLDEWVNRHSER